MDPVVHSSDIPLGLRHLFFQQEEGLPVDNLQLSLPKRCSLLNETISPCLPGNLTFNNYLMWKYKAWPICANWG